MNRWTTQMVEQARRQKGKACLLAGIFVVAVMMWAPILGSWVTAGEVTPPSPLAMAAPTTIHKHSKAIQWQAALERRQGVDRRPFELNEGPLPDPFAQRDKPEKKQQPKREEEATAVTPQQAGLVLNSTMKVGSVGAASINDELYVLGQEIVIDQRRTGFLLTDVARGHAVVERDGTFYRMEVEKNEHSKQTIIIETVNAARD